jgi:putative oxidoreductase
MDSALRQLSTEPAVPSTGRRQTVLRAVEILAGLFIAIGSGLPKLFGEATAVEMFDDIGWGDWFRYLVGALEVLGGIGLILPKTTRLAAICLCGLMIGAVVFTLAYLEVEATIVTPMILCALFAFIAWSRRTA